MTTRPGSNCQPALCVRPPSSPSLPISRRDRRQIWYATFRIELRSMMCMRSEERGLGGKILLPCRLLLIGNRKPASLRAGISSPPPHRCGGSSFLSSPSQATQKEDISQITERRGGYTDIGYRLSSANYRSVMQPRGDLCREIEFTACISLSLSRQFVSPRGGRLRS